MREYKAVLKKDLYLVVAYIFLMVATILLSSTLSRIQLMVFVIFLSGIILLNFLSSRLIKVQVDNVNNRLTLIYGNYFHVADSKDYDVARIELTYKAEATTFRGGVKNVCSIYYADRRIEKLIPDQNGWDDDEIKEFTDELLRLGVKKKFIGYTLKDVEV